MSVPAGDGWGWGTGGGCRKMDVQPQPLEIKVAAKSPEAQISHLSPTALPWLTSSGSQHGLRRAGQQIRAAGGGSLEQPAWELPSGRVCAVATRVRATGLLLPPQKHLLVSQMLRRTSGASRSYRSWKCGNTLGCAGGRRSHSALSALL